MSRILFWILLLPLISFSLLISCKKETEAKITGIYKPESTMQLLGAPVMYTRNGQVVDNNIVTNFLSRLSLSDLYNTTLVTNEVPVTTLNFLDNGLLKVTTNELIGTSTVHAEIYNRSNTQLDIRHLDSSFIYYTAFDTCSYFIDLIKGFEKISNCIPLGAPNTFFCKYRPTFSIKIEDGQFYQYLITSTVKNTYPGIQFPGGPPPPDGYCLFTIKNGWDNFDQNIISRLGKRDTIIIQRKKVRLNKQ